MKCSQCISKIPEETKYCSICGSKIAFKAKNKEGDLIAVMPTTEGKRFLNHILDAILGIIICSPVLVYVLFIMAAVHTPQDLLVKLVFPLNMLIVLLYFIVSEAVWGQTAGKLITKTIVLNNKGKRITWGQAIIRMISRYIPFEPLSLLGSKNPVGWHDSLAKTYVVDKKVWLTIKSE